MSRRRFYLGILVLYLAVVAGTTLTPGPSPADPLALRWVPFVGTYQMLVDGDSNNILAQVTGNVALFVPMGWLLPMVSPSLRQGKRRRIVLIAALASLSIELAQLLLVSGRAPAIDDVILNTSGAALGVVMFFAPRYA
ncbi:hypothetical protein BH24ACT26_BH24ACT26_12390 [soil metagenome]